MILIADSGSTKTDWACISGVDNTIYFTSEGYNPYFVESQTISFSLAKYLPESIDKEAITAIYFFGAGCFDDKISIITDGLSPIFPNSKIKVELDILGAAISVLGNKPGFAAILGTGMNTCLFDGIKITQNIDSLGYILGDEGSGASLGKKLLADFIRGKMPTELATIFSEKYQLSKKNIFENIYNKPQANRYCASFVPFILENKGIALDYNRGLVKNEFNQLFENLITQYPNYQLFTFNCAGSIGFYFRDILEETANQFGMKVGKIIKSPIQGLAEYFG